jgi:hypothetical protein
MGAYNTACRIDVGSGLYDRNTFFKVIFLVNQFHINEAWVKTETSQKLQLLFV